MDTTTARTVELYTMLVIFTVIFTAFYTMIGG